MSTERVVIFLSPTDRAILVRMTRILFILVFLGFPADMINLMRLIQLMGK